MKLFIFYFFLFYLKKEYNNDRVTLYQGDQSKIDDLKNIVSKLNPNNPLMFIIDDGSHIPEHQILSFDILFNEALQDGGVYIIEDIELSYWKNGSLYGNKAEYGWKNTKSLIEKFIKLSSLNFEFITFNILPHSHEK